MKMPARLVASEALKVVSRNSRRSIIGSARVSWRRAKDTPTTSPTRTAETASPPIPSWAISFSPNTTASTATRDMAALTRSRRPASGSRYSGRTRGPRMSRAAITGSAMRKTEPHQKRSSSAPPSTGPIAPPTEKLVIQIPIAVVRWRGSANMAKISDSVDGARVAPAIPSSARLAISCPALVDRAASPDPTPEAVAQCPHGDQDPGDHEPVDVGDPQQLGAAQLQVRAQGRHGQVQHRQVHGVQQAGEGEHGQ